ncbi:MAG: hypothetical protein ACK5LY_02385 [Lachnospirales bacterium]
MVNYYRKEIQLCTFKDTYQGKNKKIFGSCIIEDKEDKTTIKVKAYGLTMGEPHCVNIIFNTKSEGLHNYVTLGKLNFTNGVGEFKGIYENSKIEIFDVSNAEAVFIEVKSNKNKESLILLFGNVDKDYIFDKDIIEYKSILKEERNKCLEDIKVNLEVDTNEEVKSSDIYRKIENKSLWVEPIELETLKETLILDENTIYKENKNVNTNFEEDKKSINKDKIRKGKISDFNKAIFGDEENTHTNYSLKILEKLKDEVENLAELSSKSDEEVARLNQKNLEKDKLNNSNNSIENIFETYEKIIPFEKQNIDVDWRIISIKELGVLQKKYWKLFYEPIIVDAYDKYKLMILGEYYTKNNEVRHLLGIRDLFLKDNLNRAVNAGILQFKPEKANQETCDGCLGYWIVRL